MKILKTVIASSLIAAAMLTGCSGKKNAESTVINSGEVNIDIEALKSQYSAH